MFLDFFCASCVEMYLCHCVLQGWGTTGLMTAPNETVSVYEGENYNQEYRKIKYMLNFKI